MDREQRLVVEPVDAAGRARRRSRTRAQALLDEGGASHPEVKQRFSFAVKSRERSALGTCLLRKGRHRQTAQLVVPGDANPARLHATCPGRRPVRRRAGPRDADVRGRDRAPDRGDRAGQPPHRRPPPERGRARRSSSGSRSRRSARRCACSSSPGSSRCAAAKSGGIFVVTDLVPAVAHLHRGEARGAARRSTSCAPAACSSARSSTRRCGVATARRLRRARADDRPAGAAPRRAPERDAGGRDVPPRARPRAAGTRRSRRRCAASAAASRRSATPTAAVCAYDRQTLDVHRRQLAAMRRRDPDELDEVLDEHFRMLETQFAKGDRPPLVGPLRRPRPRRYALIGL